MTLPALNLMPGDAPFRSDPKNSYTLPARFYHDPEIWEAEKICDLLQDMVLCGSCQPGS